ncbi:MAG: Hsp20 family protein [Rhodospirillaceae bacterium]
MRTFDFSPLYRSAVGFDRLMSLVDAAQKSATATDGYPPYNIEKTDDDAYQVTVAVAGFGPDDIDVEVRDGQLVIVGKGSSEEDQTRYLHRGIARRAFERRFQLADHVEVKSADLRDGLLVIDLVREIPEAMKPRKIAIKGAGKVIENRTAEAA